MKEKTTNVSNLSLTYPVHDHEHPLTVQQRTGITGIDGHRCNRPEPSRRKVL